MRKFFSRNPLMKLLSLAMAVFLWLFVRGEQNVEVSLTVPVEPLNIPSEFVVVGDVEPLINLRISGPRTRLQGLKAPDLGSYRIDLSAGRQGMNAFAVYDEDFRIPRGASITRISPEIIRIEMDRAEERPVRVEPRFVGNLEEGFELVGWVAEPSVVAIRGSRSELAMVNSLYTEPINLTGRRKSFEGVFGLPYRKEWGSDKRRVSVRVRIFERPISKVLEGITVLPQNASVPVRVEPPSVALRLEGLAGAVLGAEEESLAVTLDARRINPEKGTLRLRLRPVPPSIPGVEITVIPGTVLLLSAQ